MASKTNGKGKLVEKRDLYHRHAYSHVVPELQREAAQRMQSILER